MKKALLIFIISIIWSQVGFATGGIVGSATGTVGQSATYTFNNGTTYTTFNWTFNNGYGTVTSSTRSGATFTLVVKWISAGTEIINFVGNGSTISSKSVVVSCPGSVATPTAGFSYPNGTTACTSLGITYSFDDNGTGLIWYWQTSSTGTSTANSTLSYTATSVGTQSYYLRAYCGGTWSTAQATASVTVNAVPTVSASGQTFCTGGTTSIVLTNNLASTLNSWTVSTSLVSGASNSSGTSGSSNPYTYTISQTLSNSSSSQGSATYTVTPSKSGCTGSAIGVTAYVNPNPTSYSVGGGGSICSGGNGSVTLSGSQSGYYYYLMPGSIEMNGTGGVLTWSGLQSAGTYTVNATTVPAGCQTTMRGSASITVNPLPTVYTVSGGGTICSGQTGPSINLSGSQTGINYQLYVNGSPTGAPVAGTNSALGWSNQATGGSYTVVATNASTGCVASMSSSAAVTVNALPTQYSMGGGGAICSGASTTVTLSGSQSLSGMYYQLQINGSNSGSAQAGTGSSLSWTGQTSSGTYTVIATYNVTGCAQGMSGSATISINSLPTVYSLNVGNLCTGSTATVSLTGSQSGVSYQLQINSSNVGSPISGTGSALSFPNQSSAGSYQVVATNASTGCTSNSPGSPVIVTALPLPTASVSAAVSACSGATMPSITFTFSGTAPFNFVYSNGTTTTPINAYGSTTYVLTNPAAGTYSVTSLQHNNGCYGTSLGTPATATVIAVPNALASPSSQTICSGSPGTINITNPNGVSGTNFTWTTSGLSVGTPAVTPPGNIISGTFTNADQFNPSSVTYTVTPYTSSCVGTPVTATVTVNPTPVAPVGTAMAYGTFPTLYQVIVPPGMQAQWYYGATGGPAFNTTSSVQNTAYDDPSWYYVSMKNISNACESARTKDTTVRVPKITSSSVAKEIIRVAGQTTDAGINNLNLLTQKAKTVAYLDGLSRPIQTLAIKAAQSTNEVVLPFEYDSYGRSPKSYLPYTKNDSTGALQSTYKADQLAFYAASGDKIADDTVPYTTTRYELSSLGRPLEQSDVGAAWRIGQGTARTKRVTYGYNTGANGNIDDVEEVRQLATDGSSTGFYAANKLTRVAVTDENGNLDIVFKNSLGKIIVRKQQLNGTINGVTVNYLQTYYVYDDFNRIKYIIPPAGQAALKTNGWVLSTSIMNQHLHQFVYDSRGRLAQKKAPGQAVTSYVYDKLNRLVLTQDGNLWSQNKWAFVKYDLMGRTVMTGLYTNNTLTTLKAVQDLLDDQYAGTTLFYETRGTASPAYSFSTGYTNQSFPKQNADASALEIWTINYYDNYDFDNNGTADYNYDNTHLSGLPATSGSYIRGLATGNWKLILGTTNYLKTAVFYDNYGRVIQRQSNNHLYLTSLNQNKSSITYDFEGKTVKTYTTHTPDGTNLTNVLQTPVYDNQGRVSQVYHQINTGINQLVASCQYNDLGQPVTKQLHNTGGSNYLQNVDYRYNIQGWLTSINNAALSNDGGVTNNDTNDFFGMELMYNNTDALGNTAYFNGNVSAIKWKGAGNGSTATGERSYKFSYDKTDKLVTATFQKYGTTAWDQEANTLNESQTYDHNGNILTLQRNQNQRTLSGTVVTNTAQSIDNLTYSYSATAANQLTQVEDASSNTAGFNNGYTASGEYTYNNMGNLTADQNKGITGITYNMLGKPSQINITTGGVTKVITYTYDASGTKLKMATTISGTTTTTDYVNGFVYTNTVLNFFPSPEGRVIKNGSNFEYQYAIADHQGNTRLLFTSATPTPVSTIATFGGDPGDQSAQFTNVTSVVSFHRRQSYSGRDQSSEVESKHTRWPGVEQESFCRRQNRFECLVVL